MSHKLLLLVFHQKNNNAIHQDLRGKKKTTIRISSSETRASVAEDLSESSYWKPSLFPSTAASRIRKASLAHSLPKNRNSFLFERKRAHLIA